jgi:hypothetical protein
MEEQRLVKNTLVDYYVYAYLRTDGTPYYIGKGRGGRAWQKHHKIINKKFSGIAVPPDKNRIILVETNLTEIGAFALERRFIRWYGRKDLNTGILRNRTDGGEGGSGIIVSEESRKLRSQRNKGQGLGRKLSEETKQKMRGRTYSPEVRAKMGAPKGTVPSQETRRKISEARKGKPNLKNIGRKMTQDEINNRTMSRKNNGKPWFTEEQRLKIAEATKKAIAKRKAQKLAQNNVVLSTIFTFE